MPTHFTVSDEISKFAPHHTLKCWEISNHKTVFRFPSELPRLYGISIGRTQKKNENIINDLYGTFWKLQKFIPSKKNQSPNGKN